LFTAASGGRYCGDLTFRRGWDGYEQLSARHRVEMKIRYRRCFDGCSGGWAGDGVAPVIGATVSGRIRCDG